MLSVVCLIFDKMVFLIWYFIYLLASNHFMIGEVTVKKVGYMTFPQATYVNIQSIQKVEWDGFLILLVVKLRIHCLFPNKRPLISFLRKTF